MIQYWNKYAVAALQVIGICSEELVRRIKSKEESESAFEFSFDDDGYPLSRMICHCLNYFDSIDDDAAIRLLDSYGDHALFLDIFANAELGIESKQEVFEIISRKIIGRLSIIAPLEDLSWILVSHYENEIMGEKVKFRFIDASAGETRRNLGLNRLLEIADNNGVGEHLVKYADL